MTDDQQTPQAKQTQATAESQAASEMAQRTATAYHEAGHAVMAHVLGRIVQKVTIAPGKSPFGRVHLGVCELQKGRTKATKDRLEDEALILLAGMVAEARLTGKYCPQGAGQDLRHVHGLLTTRATTQNQLEKLQRRLLDKTEHLMHDTVNIATVELVASELLCKTTISGRAVRHLYQQVEAKKKT